MNVIKIDGEGNEKPPSPDGHTDNTELHIPSSSNLRCLVFGCRTSLAGIGCFRSLAGSGIFRRDSLLEVNKACK